MSELEIVEPLDAQEIKDGLVVRIIDSLLESLNAAGCDLYGVAYPRFKASWKIEGELDNFGDAKPFSVSGAIDYTPPNIFRKEAGLGVPVVVTDDLGNAEQKAVFYKRGRRSHNGRRED